MLGSMPSRLVNSVRHHGLFVAARRGFRRGREWLRERQLGIRTAGSIDAASLKSSADSFGYQPIPYAAFENALAEVATGETDVFLDFGCGMGRAVILAGLRPFRRSLGVEISPELCSLARRNIEQARRHFETQEVDIIEADAVAYVIPDDVTIVLLFNPFDEPILRRVLENVRQSLERVPRPLTIIYAIPTSRHDLLAEVSWLRLQDVVRIPDEVWLHLAIYRNRKGLK